MYGYSLSCFGIRHSQNEIAIKWRGAICEFTLMFYEGWLMWFQWLLLYHNRCFPSTPCFKVLSLKLLNEQFSFPYMFENLYLKYIIIKKKISIFIILVFSPIGIFSYWDFLRLGFSQLGFSPLGFSPLGFSPSTASIITWAATKSIPLLPSLIPISRLN